MGKNFSIVENKRGQKLEAITLQKRRRLLQSFVEQSKFNQRLLNILQRFN